MRRRKVHRRYLNIRPVPEIKRNREKSFLRRRSYGGHFRLRRLSRLTDNFLFIVSKVNLYDKNMHYILYIKSVILPVSTDISCVFHKRLILPTVDGEKLKNYLRCHLIYIVYQFSKTEYFCLKSREAHST